jgi:hypothetical protein
MQERMLNTVSVPLRSAWIVGCRAAKGVALVAALVALCVVSGGLAHAGSVYSWTKTMGGASDDSGDSAAVDGGGNVYVTGSFQGTVDFDPGPGTEDNHISNGGADIFLTKFTMESDSTGGGDGGGGGCFIATVGSGVD